MPSFPYFVSPFKPRLLCPTWPSVRVWAFLHSLLNLPRPHPSGPLPPTCSSLCSTSCLRALACPLRPAPLGMRLASPSSWPFKNQDWSKCEEQGFLRATFHHESNAGAWSRHGVCGILCTSSLAIFFTYALPRIDQEGSKGEMQFFFEPFFMKLKSYLTLPCLLLFAPTLEGQDLAQLKMLKCVSHSLHPSA